jgi:hypothetical protein
VKDILYAVCIAPNRIDHVLALQARGARKPRVAGAVRTLRITISP